MCRKMKNARWQKYEGRRKAKHTKTGGRNGFPRADKGLLVYARRIVVETADKGCFETLQFVFWIIIIFVGRKIVKAEKMGEMQLERRS